jgi:hypothetical protein
VATGEKVDSGQEGGFENGRWRSGVPFAVAGFNLGEYKGQKIAGSRPQIEVLANRELEEAIAKRFSQTPVREAPSVAVDLSQGLQNAGNEEYATPPPPSPAAMLKQLGSEVLNSIGFFEKLNGPFPFARLEISQIPGSMGQGWPGLIYLSTFAYLPAESEQKTGLAPEAQEAAREIMPFHEVGHQWWGNVTGPSSYRDTWIEEAISNYLAILYEESGKPSQHRMVNWLERFRSALLTKAPESTDTVESEGPLVLGFRLESSKDPSAYDTITYGKGTWVIHMLREMLREPSASDPDQQFRALLEDILKTYRFRAFTNSDFEKSVEKHMTRGMDLEGTRSMKWFFDDWVYGTGIPRYKVEYQVKAHGQEFEVRGIIEQADVPDTFTASVPLYATHAPGKSEFIGAVVTTGPETRFHFQLRARPHRILIEPNETLLCRTD